MIKSFCTSFTRKMSGSFVEKAVALPPNYKRTADLQGMTILDRDKFRQVVSYECINVPFSECSQVRKILKSVLIKLPNFKAVQSTENSDGKCFILNPSLVKESHSTIQELTLRYNLSVVCRDFTIGYENMTLQQISHLVLPQNQSLTGFSQIGHIAHFNLRTDSLPYKSLIGEVVLEKVPTVRTVVNKIENVSTQFRNFSFEILAGERNTVAQVVEHGVKFGLDFAKVYWNTRLSSEHQRIVQMLSKDSVLIDAFCGVGPFAIPALKKGCKVYANDLNPDSVEWLSKNVKLNKLSDQNIRVFNLDASDFFTAALTEIFGPRNKTKNELLDSNNSETYHITMNLPALAYTFLERFKNAMHEVQRPKNAKIFLHVYCFVSKTGSKMEAIKLTFDSLNLSSLSIENFASGCNVHDVRQVSANKSMVCVSFDVNSVLFKDTSADASADNCELNPCSKRPKLESFT